MPSERADESVVRVTRTFSASRERVFRAWTQPEQFVRWFGEPGSTVRIIRFDAREGGEYDIEGDYQGELWRVKGAWREVRPPERLVFTWRSWLEGSADQGSGDTVVTVELHARGSGTELVLVHSGFIAAIPRREHEKGWVGCLDRMAAVVEDKTKKEDAS